jgi:hypothetical protein
MGIPLKSDYCLGSKTVAESVTIVSLTIAVVLSMALLIAFKLVYKGDGNFWFSLRSHYWWPNLVLSGSLVVYQFSESLILALFLFPLI